MIDVQLTGGQIILADLDPTVGSEQAGRRPVLVLSEELMHRHSRRAIVCPITRSDAPWPTKIELPAGIRARGYVLTDQVRAIDYRERALRVIGSVPQDFLQIVRGLVGRLIGLELPR